MTAGRRRAVEWRIFRSEHYRSQRELARMLKCGRRTVQDIELGNSSPTKGLLTASASWSARSAPRNTVSARGLCFRRGIGPTRLISGRSVAGVEGGRSSPRPARCVDPALGHNCRFRSLLFEIEAASPMSVRSGCSAATANAAPYLQRSAALTPPFTVSEIRKFARPNMTMMSPRRTSRLSYPARSM